MGGGELARDFLKDDLVDELYIGIVPVLIGEGIPLFPSGFPAARIHPLENKTFSKGMIALKYARTRKNQSANVGAGLSSSNFASLRPGKFGLRSKLDCGLQLQTARRRWRREVAAT